MVRVTNKTCWREAQRYLVGGVNSPVRSFRAVGRNPFFVDRGSGPYLWDVEGNRYLDFVGSWGTLILGHRHPAVLRLIREALKRGTTFGTPTPSETALARMITRAIPSIEQVRFVSSGTEAVMSAIRLARGATGRQKVIKFDGGYHGHLDTLLTQAGSGLATLGIPASPGVPKGVTQDTLTASFNDLEGVTRLMRRYGKQVACIVVEPVLANIGVIPPAPGFLKGLKALTRNAGALLVFDEVITGFRVAYSGAQGHFGIRPDLTILGKVIGGGFPIGAYGGARRWMKQVAPAGPIYQAGTLAGHPVAMAAGLATLEVLAQPGVYAALDQTAKALQEGLLSIAKKRKVPVTVHQIGGLVALFFSDRPIQNGTEARKVNTGRYARYFRRMLSQGVYLPPSAFEAWFLSTAMGHKELQMTLRAHQRGLSLGV